MVGNTIERKMNREREWGRRETERGGVEGRYK